MRYLITCFMLICLIATASAGNKGQLNGWPAILQDYNDGLITLDQKAQLALTLLTNPENLPPRYQIDHPMKDATVMILDIMTVRGEIDPDIINQYFLTLTRVNKQKFYNTPEGHFRINYDTTGTHAVYQPTVDVNPADGVPDYVNRTAEYFERAWTVQSDTLGYDTPPYDGGNGGGMDLYDVYMHRYSGAYGVTWPESNTTQRPGRNNDMTSYIYVDPTYSGFGYSDRTLPMKVTSAHEFFHATQFAYNANAGGWFMENCAVWMEEKMWDDINDCYFYMNSFFNNTHYAINTANGAFEYGAFVWPTFLDESYGQDIIRTIWEWTINTSAFNAMLAVLENYGSGIVADYPEFAVWNYLTGARNDGEHYSEGSGYNLVRIMRTHTTYPVIDNNSFLQPGTLGSNYILFSRGSNTGNLHITFNGGDSGVWIIPVVKSLSTNQHQFDYLETDENGDGDITIYGIQNYVGVAIIPCLVYGPSSNYIYGAEIDTATSIDDLTGNLPSELRLTGNYPNPFNGSTVISFETPASCAGEGNIDIYNMLGQKINTLSIPIQGGKNTIHINNWNNTDYASGIYYYRIEMGENTLTGRMTYLK